MNTKPEIERNFCTARRVFTSSATRTGDLGVVLGNSFLTMSPPPLTNVAVAASINGTIELAGPEPIPAGQTRPGVSQCDQRRRKVITLGHARYSFRDATAYVPPATGCERLRTSG